MGYLICIKKIVYHAYAKNGKRQYSFYGAGDYRYNENPEEVGEETCKNWNENEGYKKFTFEIVRLYGECSEW